jgi:hypothetical protein
MHIPENSVFLKPENEKWYSSSKEYLQKEHIRQQSYKKQKDIM